MMVAKNPVEMLLHWAKEHPQQPWLFQPAQGQWHSMTWGEAEAQVRSMAAALKALGYAPGTRIAVSGRNTTHFFLADLAIAMAGCISVGLYPKQSLDAVKFILTHSETKAIIVGPALDIQEFMGAIPAGITKIAMPYDEVPPCDYRWDELVRQHAPLEAYTPPDPKDLWTLVYTSGTTGNPKGVMITGENIQFAVQGMLKAMPPKGQERFFSYLPLAHAFERGAVEVASIYLGGEVYFLESIEKLPEQLKEVAPTRFFGVPLVFGRIQAGILKKMPQQKLDRLLRIPILSSLIKKKIKQAIGLQNARYVIVGAAPMPIPLLEWFQKLGITILQGYGMTENNIYATVNLPNANRIGSVGRPLPGANMKISEEGEILFKHPAVMIGYYKEPEKTREVFTEDGYLRTGDKGRVDGDGYLYITGRVKDIFKTLKGKYVAPAPIEGALSRNTDIDQLCFVGAGLKQPIMLVTLQPDARQKPREEIEKGLLAEMDAVNQTLEAHEQIGKIVVLKDSWTIDNNLMTPTMKVKRNVVEERYAALLASEAENRSKIAWEV